jgi:hypothetical protein
VTDDYTEAQERMSLWIPQGPYREKLPLTVELIDDYTVGGTRTREFLFTPYTLQVGSGTGGSTSELLCDYADGPITVIVSTAVQ